MLDGLFSITALWQPPQDPPRVDLIATRKLKAGNQEPAQMQATWFQPYLHDIFLCLCPFRLAMQSMP
jgi:hypothetical protein